MAFGFPLRPRVVISTPPPEPKVEEVVEVVESAPATTTVRWGRRWLFWRGIFWSLVALGIQTTASLMPGIVEIVYSQKIYYYSSRLLSFFNRFVGFSVGEVFFVALAIYFTIWTLWYMRHVVRGESNFFEVMKILALHMLWTFSTLFFFFLLLWGLNYQRMPISETWGLERRPARSDELQSIAARIVGGINRSYAAAAEGQDWAGVSRLPLTTQRLNQVLETSFQNTGALREASQGGLGVPKPLNTSRFMNWLGISGIYMPFTGEPTYNIYVTPSEMPFVIANQKAHQRGYAREDEANFVAYVVCTNSSDPYVQYSGYLHAVKVLDVIEGGGIGRYKDQIGPGPSADLDATRQNWGAVRNKDGSNITNALISAYLRLNRINEGVANYDKDVPLIIGYHLKNNGTQERVE